MYKYIYIDIYLSIYTYAYYAYTYIIELCNRILYIYIWNRNYKFTYLKESFQQVFIYNEEAQCTSHTLCDQVLELPQSHFGDDLEDTLYIYDI